MRINVKVFALICGIMWGFGLFALTWWIIAFDGVTHEVTLIGRLYRLNKGRRCWQGCDSITRHTSPKAL